MTGTWKIEVVAQNRLLPEVAPDLFGFRLKERKTAYSLAEMVMSAKSYLDGQFAFACLGAISGKTGLADG